MTDKEYEKQKRRIRKLIKKWVKPLGLHWWRMDFAYRRDANTNHTASYSPKLNGNGNQWVVVMDTSADPYYRKGLITVYLPELQDMPDDELEECFLHELMHVFLSPMHNQKVAKEEESVAQSLALAFIWINKRNSSK
jgi:hypothetical protein